MDTTILSSLLVLLPMICVIVVVAYLLTRSRFFPAVPDGHPAVKIQVILVLVFGALSVYGTVTGITNAEILRDVKQFSGDHPQSDDITVTVIRGE